MFEDRLRVPGREDYSSSDTESPSDEFETKHIMSRDIQNQVVVLGAQNPDPRVMTFLVRNMGFTEGAYYAAVQYGRLGALKTMTYIFRFGTKGKSRAYHKSIHPKMLWTHLHCTPPPHDLPATAAMHGQLEILKWLLRVREQLQEMTEIIQTHRLGCCGRKMIWDHTVVKAAVTQGHWSCFRFLLSKDFMISPSTFEDCFCARNNFSTHICLSIVDEFKPNWLELETPDWFQTKMTSKP